MERLYGRIYNSPNLYSSEQAWELCALSGRLNRQIGLLINRQGRVELVILGTASRLFIPVLGRSRLGQGRLRGLGLLHTHLGGEEIDQEDLMDLLFLRLDYLAVLGVDKNCAPSSFQYSHLMPVHDPDSDNDAPYYVSRPQPWDRVEMDFAQQIQAIETEMSAKPAPITSKGVSRKQKNQNSKAQFKEQSKKQAQEQEGILRPRAVLVSVSRAAKIMQERFLAELAELAESAGVEVGEFIYYRPQQENARLLLGEGKLAELEVAALKARADMIIFDGELSAAQIDNLARTTERKVLDRTMLILDIFAQRASSAAGKLQVEMAQLQYTLPRLAGRNVGRAMDRLSGGIGGRGPGETKLETDRRKIRDRIARIKLELHDLMRQRTLSRNKREKAGLPVVCLVGYTNAGKSTLLNSLTSSNVYTENKLFATLDSTARRLFIPAPTESGEGNMGEASNQKESGLAAEEFDFTLTGKNSGKDVILTDTVGFIRDLPSSLREAFKATLEELEGATMFLHVADCSHPDLDLQVEAVDGILQELGLEHIPSILVLNKWDALVPQKTDQNDKEHEEAVGRMLKMLKRYPQAVPASAKEGQGLNFLLQQIAAIV